MVNAEGFAHLDTLTLCRATFASPRTARRWKAAATLPRWAYWILSIRFGCALGSLCEAWDGWHLRRGKLEAPNGWQFTPAELIAMPLRLQEIAALRAELRLLAQQIQDQDAARDQVVHIVPASRDRDLIHFRLAPPTRPALAGSAALREPAELVSLRLTLTHGAVSPWPWPSPSAWPASLPALPAAPLRPLPVPSRSVPRAACASDS